MILMTFYVEFVYFSEGDINYGVLPGPYDPAESKRCQDLQGLDRIWNFVVALEMYNRTLEITPHGPDLLNNRALTLEAIHLLGKHGC
jgi:hypothetical protein